MVVQFSDIPGHSSIPEDYTGSCLAGGDLPFTKTPSLGLENAESFNDVAIHVDEEAERDLVRDLLLNKTTMQALDLVAQIANPILGVENNSSMPSGTSKGLLGAKTEMFRVNTFRLNTTRLNTTRINSSVNMSTPSDTESTTPVERLPKLDFLSSLRQELSEMEKKSASASQSVDLSEEFSWEPASDEDNNLAIFREPMLPLPKNSTEHPLRERDGTPLEEIPLVASKRLSLTAFANISDRSRSRSRPRHGQKKESRLKKTKKKPVVGRKSVRPDLTPVVTPQTRKKSVSVSASVERDFGPAWKTLRGTLRNMMGLTAPTMRACDFDENAIENPEELKLDHSKGTAIGTGGYSWVTEYVIIFFPAALLGFLLVSDVANLCTKGLAWMSAWNTFWACFRMASAVFMATCFHAYLHIVTTPTIHHVLPLPMFCGVVALVGPLISSSFFLTRLWCLSVILGVGSAVTIHSVRSMLSSGEAFFLSYDLGDSSMGKALKVQIRQNLRNWFVSLADLVTVLWLVYPFIELARVSAEQMSTNWGGFVASLYKISVLWLQVCNSSGMFRDLSPVICLLNWCYPLARHFLLNPAGNFTAEALLYAVLALLSFSLGKAKEFRTSPGFVVLMSLNVWFYGFDGVSMVDVLFGWRFIVFWHVFTKFSHWVQRMRHSILYRMAYCHDMSANTKKPVKTLHSLNCQHFIRFENWFLNFVMHCLKVWDVTILLRMVRDFKPMRYEQEELRIRLGTQMLNTSMLLTFTGTENNGKVGVFKFKNMMFPLAAPTLEYLREMVVKVDLETRMLLDFHGTMDTYSMEMLRFCIHKHQPSKAVAPTIDFIYKLRQKHPQVKRMFKEYERKFHCELNKYDQKINVKTTGWARMAAMLDTLFAFGTHPVVHGFGGSYEDKSLMGQHTHAMTHGNNFLGESSNFVIATLCASHVPVEAISLSVVNNEQNFPESFFKSAGHAQLRKLENVSLLAKIHNITIDNLLTVWRKCPDAPYKPSDAEFRKMAVYFINNSIMHSLDHALQYKISSFRHYMNDLDFHRYQPAAVSARYLTEQIPGTGERTSNWAPFVGWVQEWHTKVVHDMKQAGIHDPKEAEAKYGIWGDIEDIDLCIDF